MTKNKTKGQVIKIKIDATWGNQTRQDRAIQHLELLLRTWQTYEESKCENNNIKTTFKYADK